ncbi:MAG: hypothetical protein RI560_04760 [Natronomonas sp.]|nr:hypothetical protein [Natronomonas sp.]
MQYCGQDRIVDYLNFSTSSDAPVKAVVCPFTQGGVGIPPEVLSLFVFGAIGLTLTYRIRHPAPILVAFMLTGGVAAGSAPGRGINILAAVVFIGISAMGLYLYSRAGRQL